MSVKRANPKQRALDASTPMQELTKLAGQSTELARLVARNTAAPEALLKTLGSHRDATVRKWVASNPNTPPPVLLKLAQQFPEQLLDNPILDLLFLENPNLFADMPVGTVRALMKRPRTPECFIRYAMGRDDEGVQLAIAQNRSTPEDIIERLKDEGVSEKVRAAASAWRRLDLTPEEAEDAFWQEGCFRISAWDRQKKERQLFTKLILDADFARVGGASWIKDWRRAGHSSTSSAELIELARSNNAFVHLMLIERDSLPPLAESILAANARPFHKEAIAARSKSPSVLELLCQSEYPLVWKGLAKNPLASPECLTRLANRLMGLQNLFWHIKGRNAFDFLSPSQILDCLAANPSTPPKILIKLSEELEFDRSMALITNPSTPASVLVKIARRRVLSWGDQEVLYAIAGSPTTPLECLEHLSRKRNDRVRCVVAKNPSTSVDVLERLARVKDTGVRRGVAQNPSTTHVILEHLGKDRDQQVRKAAEKNMAREGAAVKRVKNPRR